MTGVQTCALPICFPVTIRLVANGSEGQISVDHDDAKMGPVARLKNVKVDTLIEYVKPEGSGYESGDEFSTADDDDGGTVKVPAKAKTATAPKGKKPPVDDEGDSDQSPF